MSPVRASGMVNCQSTCRWLALTVFCHAVSSALRVSRSAMRRSRHWRVRAASSISAMLSQDPCVGVWWISQPLCQGERRGWFEWLVERADRMGVEVVHHQNNRVRVGIVVGEQPVDLASPVPAGAMLTRGDPAITGQRQVNWQFTTANARTKLRHLYPEN